MNAIEHHGRAHTVVREAKTHVIACVFPFYEFAPPPICMPPSSLGSQKARTTSSLNLLLSLHDPPDTRQQIAKHTGQHLEHSEGSDPPHERARRTSWLKNLAFTMTGTSGRRPLPRTLK